MKLVAMVPQIYRFVGEGNEQIHIHRETEGLVDEKFRWGWCNLNELWEMIVAGGLQGPIESPWHLIKLEHLYNNEDKDKNRKRLFVAVQAPDTTRFIKGTQANTELLEGIDPKKLFVPVGWAQAVVKHLSLYHDPIQRNRFMALLVKGTELQPDREISQKLGYV